MNVIIDEVNDCNKDLRLIMYFFNKYTRDIGIQCIKSILIISQCNKYAHTPILLLRHYCRFRVTSALVLGQF
jgi:hypothetical protein